MNFKNLRTSFILLLIMTLITGVFYPLLITGIAQLIFPSKANGSLIIRDGNITGSDLIGQPFSNPKYFWGRLSATTPFPYNAGSSAGSNYGPLNPALLGETKKRIHDLQVADPQNMLPIPVDLVTASGSGLDPHISLAGALYQLPRVARFRNLSEEPVRALVAQFTEGRQLGFLGEPRVNVLKLNLALDEIQRATGGKW
jgi:potassium-transporting ATPase KdpC subunit